MKRNKNLFVFGISFIIVAVFIWKSGLFGANLGNIEVKNASCVTEPQIRTELDITGHNILFLNENVLEKKIIDKYPCVGSIKFVRQFPKQIAIKVNGRNPLAQIVSFNPSKSSFLGDLEASPSSSTALLDWNFPEVSPENLLVDANGVVFGDNGSFKLPIIFWPEENLKIGQRLDGNIFNNISKVFSKMNSLNLNENTASTSATFENFQAKVVDNSLLIKVKPKLIFSLEKDILRQLASLQLILQKAKIDGKVIEVVDLRFDKPVVVYGKR